MASGLADGVVLPHEQRVEHGQADPPVAVDPGQVPHVGRVEGNQPVGGQQELAADVGADQVLEVGRATVDLGRIPPMGLGVAVGGRPAVGGGRVAVRALDLHRVLGPRVVVGELDLPRIVWIVAAVAEPVVHLELQPGRGQHVERRGRLELLAGQQLAADRAGVGREHVGRVGLVEAERCGRSAAPAAPMFGSVQVVARAVDARGPAVEGRAGAAPGPTGAARR